MIIPTSASTPPERTVGRRIRAIREREGLSLRALAERSGLSANAISLIERGENSPTVSSLHLLAGALNVAITAFFEDAGGRSVVFVRPAERLRSQAGGLLIESLGVGLRNQRFEPFLLTVAPGAGNRDQPVSHTGEEFVYCLEGVVDYTVGDGAEAAGRPYRLEPGCSLLFEAAQAHCFYNPGPTPAVLLLLFEAGAGVHLAQTTPGGAQ